MMDLHELATPASAGGTRLARASRTRTAKPSVSAGELGNALLRASLRHRHGIERPRDLEAADQLLTSAANAGSPTAMAMRAAALLDGSPEDVCRGMALLETLASTGNPTAQHELGIALATLGAGYDYDPDAAYRWVQAALAGGHPTAMLTLSRFYLYGIGTERDVEQALTLFEAWHDQDHGRR